MASYKSRCSRVIQKDQFLWALLLSSYVLKFIFPGMRMGWERSKNIFDFEMSVIDTDH